MQPSSVNKTNKMISIYPKYLWFLIVCYSMVLAISNWYDARLVQIFSFIISPGSLSFPLTFLVSDIITEVYGYKHARLAIWTAFLFNLVFIAFGQLVIHLPSPAIATDNKYFNDMLSINIRVIVASFLSYLISEPMNSYVVAKLKKSSHSLSKYMGIRFILSTFIASGLDSFTFATIAFTPTIGLPNSIKLGAEIWLVKVIIEVFGLPISIRLAKKLKKIEKIDVYDFETKFNIFSLNISYKLTNNLYKSENQSRGSSNE